MHIILLFEKSPTKKSAGDSVLSVTLADILAAKAGLYLKGTALHIPVVAFRLIIREGALAKVERDGSCLSGIQRYLGEFPQFPYRPAYCALHVPHVNLNDGFPCALSGIGDIEFHMKDIYAPDLLHSSAQIARFL